MENIFTTITQDKGDPYHLRRYCAPWIHSTRPKSKQVFYLDDSVMQCAIKDQENGNLVHSKIITTMHWHFLAKHHIPQAHLPPYSPDVDPWDFFLFPEIKTILKGRQFEDMEMIKLNKTWQLVEIPTTEYERFWWATGISVSKQNGPTLKDRSLSSR
jgi:hypothetical protein